MQVRQFVISIAFGCAPIVAQAEGGFTVFLGTGLSFGLYEGDEEELGLLPYISYENGPFKIGLDGVRYRFDPNDQLGVTVGLSPRGAPDYPDTTLFEGLDRDATVEALISVEYQFTSSTRLNLVAQHDVLDEHGGTEVSAALGLNDRTGAGLLLDAQAGLRYRSSALNTYLVGVGRQETSAERSAYSPGATTTPFVSLSATRPVGQRSALIGTVSYDFFGDAYHDSPLVDGRSSTSLSIGFAHSF